MNKCDRGGHAQFNGPLFVPVTFLYMRKCHLHYPYPKLLRPENSKMADKKRQNDQHGTIFSWELWIICSDTLKAL